MRNRLAFAALALLAVSTMRIASCPIRVFSPTATNNNSQGVLPTPTVTPTPTPTPVPCLPTGATCGTPFACCSLVCTAGLCQ